MKHKLANRSAAILIEVTVTLAIVLIVAVIVAQSLVWSLRERAHAATHRAALELAANVLEAARAESFEKLDASWGARQTVPAEMEGLLPAGKVAVALEAGPEPSLTKRVTVDVSWQWELGAPTENVRLTTLLAARATKKAGGQP